MKNLKKFIKNNIKVKYMLNFILLKKKKFQIKKKSLLLCKYWIKDNLRYRLIWFCGICISKKNKGYLSNFILKNKIWHISFFQQFFFFSPNFLSFKILK